MIVPPRRTLPRLPTLVVAALLAAPTLAAAQGGRPLSVRGTQGLTLGNVIPGVPTTIPYTDGARAAQFEIRGQRGEEVEVFFTLPGALAGPAGATMPLAFAANAAGLSLTGNPASASPRNPALPFTVRPTANNGRAYVFLGVTALPTGVQRAGAYSGTVSVTVAYTGL